MVVNAANGILKILEEPPENTFFILVSGKANRLLATIRSRCVQVSVTPPTKTEMYAWAAKNGVTDKSLDLGFSMSGFAPITYLTLLKN